ncbi:MAG: hypothetical protein K9N21_20330 [Deltaproteobacteria bacterium]|nr:hypothetical protein [Deltaproteobacteria bacterium]
MNHPSPKYDTSIREELDKADWEVVFPKVLRYAVSRAKKFSWLGDEVDPEALVHEAVACAYGIGTRGNFRNWNKETCPDLADFLIGIVRSTTSHKAEHEADFPGESLFHEDGTPKEEKILKSARETEGAEPKTPEEELIEDENLQAFKKLLDSLSDEDEGLGIVILCIEDGVSKPREIAEETGFDIKKVNNLLRRLRRKLENYNPKKK